MRYLSLQPSAGALWSKALLQLLALAWLVPQTCADDSWIYPEPAELPISAGTPFAHAEAWGTEGLYAAEHANEAEDGAASPGTAGPVSGWAPTEGEMGKRVVLEPGDDDDFSDGTAAAIDPLDERFVYRGSGVPRSGSWIIGTADRLGIFSLVLLDSPLFSLFQTEVLGNLAIHFVSGPNQTDLPPRVYDLGMGLRRRGDLGERWAYELAARPGVYSDFQGSLRDAWRCPAHGAVYYEVAEFLQLVLGIDYPHRDDVALVPVAGAVYRPMPELRLDLVFPQPRVAFRLTRKRTAYVAADFTGDMWAIERVGGIADVASYRDYRVVVGIESSQHTGAVLFTEIGCVFDRRLEYRSGSGDYPPLDTLLWRSVVVY